ncbi:prolyl oligopeptidase family serine peptidase [Sphingobacterium sp. DK4209]|uniref:Prolyl oligopeptidase family serine peptidase n=1 Tax=Sphingobacterium zhuxiongii TaxID=2662364 RepID=A0A5Q0QGG1_9SPHI|nr:MULTISPECIES: acetylxylan esterase [unclassified Sphingobacterium]MVZ65245.1 prolyl oligopeptidase family serine peptidase [Sphingobacterium sp. DK4209]QGA26340.1 prolyl oligopeptidase family serine peptidase [Sphingobacterium sp. dk4302]
MSAFLKSSSLFLFGASAILMASSFHTFANLNHMSKNNDSIPKIINESDYDVLSNSLTLEAARQFKKFIAPQNLTQWQNRKAAIHQFIQKKTNYKRFPDLPLVYTEHKAQDFKGFTLKNITFQTRPSTFTTANLYVPEGNGPFPAVLVMMGHSRNGKFYDNYQLLGQDLAKNGYVALLVDPWGAGERSTEHLNFEYHGSHMGGHLLDVGETLMGMQITDNIRAIDLLSSLNYVDKNLIAATGASGGGNQTMWISAVDDRIKAAIPVVSVGTFESYVMNANCICELLPDGLTFLEESEILGLVAPRKLSLFNALHDSNKAFFPSEMFRSYRTANQIYKLHNAESNLSYQLFNTTHGYWADQRRAMISWFNENLLNKTAATAGNYPNLSTLSQETLQVFEKGKRVPEVLTTETYCQQTAATLLRNIDLKKINRDQHLQVLQQHLQIDALEQKAYKNSKTEINDTWSKYDISLANGHELNTLVSNPAKSTKFKLIFAAELSKKELNDIVRKYRDAGYGILLADLTGLGINSSSVGQKFDNGLPKLHTLSRSQHWLGRSMMGLWTEEIAHLANFTKQELAAQSIDIQAHKELGVAAILASALNKQINQVDTYDAPISYVVRKAKLDSYYSQAIHIPSIINWGDLTLAAALAQADIHMHSIRDIAGDTFSSKDIEAENAKIKTYKTAQKSKSKVLLNN